MRRITLVLCFSLLSSSSWSSSCTERASLSTLLKLKDMVTGYSEQYYHEIRDFDGERPSIDNYFSFKHICKKSEILETLEEVKIAHFKQCTFKSVASGLDKSVSALESTRLTTLITDYIDVEKCSPVILTKLEDRLISTTRNIEKEMKKDRPDKIKICNIAREAFFDNFELKKECRN